MNNNELKKCHKCQLEKPITDFYLTNKTYCKLCHNQRSLDYFKQHPEKLNNKPKDKLNYINNGSNQLEFNFCPHCNSLMLNNNNCNCDYIQKLVWAAKHRAKRDQLDFNIEVNDIKIPEFCPVLGIKLEINKGGVGPNSPSLDKIISNKGYVKGNVRIISHRANWLKNNSNKDELELIYKDSLNIVK